MRRILRFFETGATPFGWHAFIFFPLPHGQRSFRPLRCDIILHSYRVAGPLEIAPLINDIAATVASQNGQKNPEMKSVCRSDGQAEPRADIASSANDYDNSVSGQHRDADCAY